MNKYLVLASFIVFFAGCRRDSTYSLLKTIPADLTIKEADIVLNPSGYAPLSAVVNYSFPEVGKTKIVVLGKNGANSNIEHVFDDYGSFHSVPVIGLYGNTDNDVMVILTNENGDSLARALVHIQTGALPPGMPTSITIDSAQYTNMEPGLNLVSSFSSASPRIPYMMDNYGDIRWLLDYRTHPELANLSYDDGIARLRNGNFYFGNEVADNPSANKIYEVDLLGRVVNSWGLSEYLFHHEVREMPNGNFLVSATNPTSKHTDGSATIEDYVIEIDRQTGSLVNTWDLKESLNEYRRVLSIENEDWLHINAVFYDSADNSIIVSGRTQCVVKLTRDNKVKWILGAHRDWGVNRRGEDLTQFLLAPLDAAGNKITDTSVINGYAIHPDFDWSWFQHSTILIPNGNLMLFDNGKGAGADPYSRAVEYKIDQENMTVQQVWEYGKERGPETFSRIVSNVQFLPRTNHVLFCPGYQVPNAGGKGGKIVEVDYATKKVIFQASISSENLWGFHRTTRISAYPK